MQDLPFNWTFSCALPYYKEFKAGLFMVEGGL
jgi:hypothetical protein